jgi:DNA-binding transcriptional LysR family regulator
MPDKPVATPRFPYKSDRLKPLRAFCQTVRLGSVSRASEALYVSQPAITLQLQALERDFDEPLFERDYLGLLIAHAARQSNHAVLGFSRSLGRMRAIKRQFRGFHVVLMRDPLQQWLSCRSYRIRSGSSYFEWRIHTLNCMF